jgi:hypothetical protein
MERAPISAISGYTERSPAPRRNSATPWGPADDARTVAEGIVSVSTPSHGGIWVSEARQLQMPRAFRQQGNWYEEDCEWALVAASFPSEFRAAFGDKTVESAERTIKNAWPERWEAFTGMPLAPGESAKRTRIALVEAHLDHRFVICAFGDWHAAVPKGMVGVITVAGETQLDWETGRVPHRSGSEESAHGLIAKEVYDAAFQKAMAVPPAALEPWLPAPLGAPYSLNPLTEAARPCEAALHHAKAGEWHGAGSALRADPYSLPTSGPIVLWLAVRSGDPEAVRACLHAGVDPEAWPLPAMAAIHAGRKDLLALLKPAPAAGPAMRL